MDCCSSSESHSESHNGSHSESHNLSKMKGGKNIIMEKRIIMWIVIGALFLAVLYLTFKAGGPSVGVAANIAQSTGSAGSAAASSGGMVGGC